MEQTSRKLFDIIIIGGGPGGYTAALYAARASRSVLVLERYAPGGQMGTVPLVENFPGFPEGVEGWTLAENMKKGAESFGVETRIEPVTSLSLTGPQKTVVTTEGTYEAPVVILATGADPRLLGLEGEPEMRGRGVSYCATCDGMFYKGKTVLVVGGGNTAVTDALYLARLAKQVILIHRRDELRALKVYNKSLEEVPNISIRWNTKVTKLEYGAVLTGAELTNTVTGEVSKVACDGLFVAIGQTPNNELVRDQLKLDDLGYIVAGEDTKTSVEGVFAVGDVRTKPTRQIITAAADGAVASTTADEYLTRIGKH